MLLVALAVFTTGGASGQSPAYATLYSFKGGADGLSPHAGVVLGANGALYGTTYEGGTGTLGTVSLLAPSTGGAWHKAVLHNFSGLDGSLPVADLVFTGNGALYGTTQEGGTGNNGGTVFELTPPSTPDGTWIESVSYSFGGGCDNLRASYSAVTTGPGGALFGTVSGSNCDSPTPTGGAVFILTPSSPPGGIWTEHTLLTFWPPTGIGFTPLAGMVFSQGSLYGTAYYTGVYSGCGSVYELSPGTAGGAWNAMAIYNFSNGCGSEAALTVGAGGVLYGTTYDGGSGLPCSFPPNLISGCGTVFQLAPPTTPGGTWTESVIYAFTGMNGDGAYPSASVVIGKNGVLYGTTQFGGSATSGSPCSYYGATGCGTVFQLTPPATPGGTWTETILHSFTGQNGDGSIPIAGLTRSSSGVLYGTASAGGAVGKGTVFSVTP
jgi:uncharacterized repeat protein (TIGR03803 family)